MEKEKPILSIGLRVERSFEECEQMLRALQPVCAAVPEAISLPTLSEWLVCARMSGTDTPMPEAHYYAALSAILEQDDERTLTYGQLFFDCIHACAQAGAPWQRASFCCESIALAMAMAAARLGRWKDCATCLCTYPCTRIAPSNMENWVNAVMLAWEHIDLAALFDQAAEALFAPVEPAQEEEGRARREALLRALYPVFDYTPVDAHDPTAAPFALIARLGDGVLDRAAALMLARGQEAILQAAFAIQNWSETPIAVLERMLRAGVFLPVAFFDISPERLEQIAGTLAARCGEEFHTLLSPWLGSHPAAVRNFESPEDDRFLPPPIHPLEDEPNPLRVQLWQFDLLIGAARMADWASEERLPLRRLAARIAWYSEQLFPKLYHPDLLQGDGLLALPGIHRFGWQLVRAAHAYAVGDLEASVQELGKALRTAPVLKGLVDFCLVDYTSRAVEQSLEKALSPSGELLALAEEVRNMLSQYSPDAPEVQAIKESSAYRNVAYLLAPPSDVVH